MREWQQMAQQEHQRANAEALSAMHPACMLPRRIELTRASCSIRFSDCERLRTHESESVSESDLSTRGGRRAAVETHSGGRGKPTATSISDEIVTDQRDGERAEPEPEPEREKERGESEV